MHPLLANTGIYKSYPVFPGICKIKQHRDGREGLLEKEIKT